MGAELNELLKKRSSARYYHADRLVDDETLRGLLEAARWAPSAMNDQPWYFIVARRQDGEAYNKLLSCMGGNQDWCKTAPLLMAEVVSKNYHYEPRPNRNNWHDMGLAVMAMAVQGVSQGLLCREMGGIERPRTVELYNIPDTHEVVCGLAFGYPVDDAQWQERLSKRERRPLSDFVFEETFGQVARIAKD